MRQQISDATCAVARRERILGPRERDLGLDQFRHRRVATASLLAGTDSTRDRALHRRGLRRAGVRDLFGVAVWEGEEEEAEGLNLRIAEVLADR